MSEKTSENGHKSLSRKKDQRTDGTMSLKEEPKEGPELSGTKAGGESEWNTGQEHNGTG